MTREAMQELGEGKGHKVNRIVGWVERKRNPPFFL
jgi:hypothetical protein